MTVVKPSGQTLTNGVQQIGSLTTPAMAITWMAASNTIYQVQYATNLPTASWSPLLTYTNGSSANQLITIWDTNAPAASSKRFYRVGYGF